MIVEKNTYNEHHKRPAAWLSVIAFILLLATPAYSQNYTIMPVPFGTVADNSGAIVVSGCVWSYAAGTTNAIATYSNNSGTQNSNPIIAGVDGRFTAYLLAGTNYKFVYENVPCSSILHGAVLRTADNIAGIPSASATVDMTCVAGETISAGQAVYLSNGSGGKTPGQCYKGDSANGYSSSTATVFGIATSAITIATSGTVRIAGSVTGLSSLTAGADYYIGGGGALTATAPVNARKLGAADTVTSMILSLPSPTSPTPFVNDFRLSLTTATCVTTADVTAATTVFWTPCTGNRITLFNTTGSVENCSSAELSLAVPASTSQMYDVWVYDTSFGACTLSLEFLAWTNDTTRATAIARSNGRWTKTGDTSRMYLGSFRTTAVSGQTEDSAVKRYTWNYYNRVRSLLTKVETTANWTYNTATYRQANAAAANQVDVVVGVAEVLISLEVRHYMSDASAHQGFTSIGEDSTTTPFAGVIGQAFSTPSSAAVGSNVLPLAAHLDKYPAVGRHFYVWLEKASAAATTTVWYGIDTSNTMTQSGVSGIWER